MMKEIRSWRVKEWMLCESNDKVCLQMTRILRLEATAVTWTEPSGNSRGPAKTRSSGNR